MGRFVLAVAVLALYIYAMLDLVRAPSAEVRLLPKWLWAVVVLLVFLLGPVLWLVLGRPRAQYPPGGGDGAAAARVGEGRARAARWPRTMIPSSSGGSTSSPGRPGWSELRREREGGQPPTGGEGSTPGEQADRGGGRYGSSPVAQLPADLRCTI